jgi:hypothetical protein
MSRRPLPFSSRFALWLFACALLLKAAVPLLASASAEAQGKALVEVCTVYGVKTITLDGDTAPDHQATHAGDHCALSAVMALAAPHAAVAAKVAPRAPQVLPAPRVAPVAADASARWRAQLKQGPPALA